MRYAVAILAGIVHLASCVPLTVAQPVIPIEPICPRSADKSVVPIDCFPDEPPHYPPPRPPPSPRPPKPGHPGGPPPIIPHPICLEEDRWDLPECQTPICRRLIDGGEWVCPPLKKRAIEGEVKRSVALKPVPSDCSAGLPICVFQFNECGECWEVCHDPCIRGGPPPPPPACSKDFPL